MRVRVVLLCCVALAAAKRANREAGYSYQVPTASPSEYAGHSAGSHQYHTSNQQYHGQLSQNDGSEYQANVNTAQTVYQPQFQVTNTQHGDNLNYQQEYSQQNDAYQFSAPSNAFTSGAQSYTHDVDTSSFGNSHQYPSTDVHQTSQFHGFQRDSLPVVNPASDSIIVEAPATPVHQQPAPIHHQPAPIHQQPAPIHHQPAQIEQYPSHAPQVKY